MAKTIIVTGASRGTNRNFRRIQQLTKFAGIGLSIAQYLISKAHNVTLLARSNEVLEEIKAQHPAQVRTFAGDVNDTSLLKQALDYTLKEFGHLDGLVINHGTLEPVARVAESEVEDWKKGFDVNFFSAVAFVGPQVRIRNVADPSRLGSLCPLCGKPTAESYSLRQEPRSMHTPGGAPMVLPKRH